MREELPTFTPDDDPETRSASAERSPGTARAGGRSVPPEALDARDAQGPDGTAAGNPLDGVLISDEDAEDAVPGDTGPEHPGTR